MREKVFVKRIIIFVILAVGSSAMSQPQGSIIGFWHGVTDSEYDVRLTLKEGGRGRLEYWDLDHETMKSHYKSWDFKWRYSEDSILLDALPWKCTLKFDQYSDSLRPVRSGGQCDYFLFDSPEFVKSTITDDRRYFVERWQSWPIQ